MMKMESERIEKNHQDEKDDSGIEQDNSFIYIRISVEDHNLQVIFLSFLSTRRFGIFV